MKRFLLGLLLAVGIVAACLALQYFSPWLRPNPSASVTTAPAAAPHEWAQVLSKPGLKNFYRVSDDLYRGAQPHKEGMRQLEAMGVRTIVNLRWSHSDGDEIGKLPLSYEHITFNVGHPEDKEVVRFLRIVTDKNRRPVFVHCALGSDRTGMMCAFYRVAVQGWSKDEAIAEMKAPQFGFHSPFENMVKYIRKIDIDWLRREAGLASD